MSRLLDFHTTINVDVSPDNIILGSLEQDSRKERSSSEGLHVENQVQQRHIPCRYSSVPQQQF
jgi:hypothetical protein